MGSTLEQPTAREDVVRALRELAARGATVRELVREIQSRLGYVEDVIVPVLWYFTQAFAIPLKDVLPIREWMGTDRDDEINSVILPAMEKTRSQWMPPGAPQSNGIQEQPLRDADPTAPDARS